MSAETKVDCTFKIDPKDKRRLEEINALYQARGEDCTVARLIRRAIKAYMSTLESEVGLQSEEPPSRVRYPPLRRPKKT